ncbi:hypothetical protein VTO73DRAFT_3265 [Trametes versicolor]
MSRRSARYNHALAIRAEAGGGAQRTRLTYDTSSSLLPRTPRYGISSRGRMDSRRHAASQPTPPGRARARQDDSMNVQRTRPRNAARTRCEKLGDILSRPSNHVCS